MRCRGWARAHLCPPCTCSGRTLGGSQLPCDTEGRSGSQSGEGTCPGLCHSWSSDSDFEPRSLVHGLYPLAEGACVPFTVTDFAGHQSEPGVVFAPGGQGFEGHTQHVGRDVRAAGLLQVLGWVSDTALHELVKGGGCPRQERRARALGPAHSGERPFCWVEGRAWGTPQQWGLGQRGCGGPQCGDNHSHLQLRGSGQGHQEREG